MNRPHMLRVHLLWQSRARGFSCAGRRPTGAGFSPVREHRCGRRSYRPCGSHRVWGLLSPNPATNGSGFFAGAGAPLWPAVLPPLRVTSGLGTTSPESSDQRERVFTPVREHRCGRRSYRPCGPRQVWGLLRLNPATNGSGFLRRCGSTAVAGGPTARVHHGDRRQSMQASLSCVMQDGTVACSHCIHFSRHLRKHPHVCNSDRRYGDKSRRDWYFCCAEQRPWSCSSSSAICI